MNLYSVSLQRIIQHIGVYSILPILGYLVYLNDLFYYTLAFFSIILISKVGGSIGNHRYFSHKSFKMEQWKENIVAFLAVLSTSGTTLQYATVHRYHHANSDNGKDLHSPYEIGFYKSFFHWYKQDPTTVAGIGYIKDLLRKPLLIKLHQYYFLVIIIYVLTITLIDINLFLFCYLLPVGYTWFNGGVLSLPLHLKGAGYRNFETLDFTNNSKLWNWLTLGEGLHNNHHARPNEYNFAFTKNPGEWDFSAWIVDNFLKIKDT